MGDGCIQWWWLLIYAKKKILEGQLGQIFIGKMKWNKINLSYLGCICQGENRAPPKKCQVWTGRAVPRLIANVHMRWTNCRDRFLMLPSNPNIHCLYHRVAKHWMRLPRKLVNVSSLSAKPLTTCFNSGQAEQNWIKKTPTKQKNPQQLRENFLIFLCAGLCRNVLVS